MEQLTQERLMAVAPSIFATAPKVTVSDKYAFIPTTTVIDTLREQNWVPVWASESRVRKEDGQGYQKHMIRFRQENMLNPTVVGGLVPELITTNSHNGLASFKFMAGIFRLVCGNGLIVATETYGNFAIRHMGFTKDAVINASVEIVKNVPTIMGRVEDFRSLQLDNQAQVDFAANALAIRWGDKAPVAPEALLTARRMADKSSDLFSVYNVVQENLMRGGLRSERRRTRSIASVNENIRVNRALWNLTETTALQLAA